MCIRDRAYALDTLQERGRLFVAPGDDCYEGMIVGESAKEGDMVVNVEKTKNLGNQRSSSADKAIQLTPPIKMCIRDSLRCAPERLIMRRQGIRGTSTENCAISW